MNALVQVPPVGTQQGNWIWDGTTWVCCPDGSVPCPPCPPFPPFGPPVFSGPTQQPPWYPGANGGVSFGTVAPANPVRGHFWWDGITLRLFDGAEWVAVGGAGGGGGSSGIGSSVFIGTSPPANPVQGQQWWNGSILQMWDGSSWQAIGPGAAAGPVPSTTIMFSMTATSARPLNPTGWSIIPFVDNPGTDPMQAWDSIQHKWTPTKAGIYEFMIRGYPVGIALLKNDPGTFGAAPNSSDIILAISSQNAGGWQQASGLSLMNGSTDYVRMWAANTSFPASGANPCFSAVLLP